VNESACSRAGWRWSNPRALGLTVAGFLDMYFTNYVEAEGLSDPVLEELRNAIDRSMAKAPST
jgi:hypothetical protein